MPQVSRNKVHKNINVQMYELLEGVISKLNNKENVGLFLSEFLSPTEKVMYAKRIAIGVLTAKEYPYRDISRILKVSTATVARYGILYKHGKSYRRFIDNIIRKEEVKDFLTDLVGEFANLHSLGKTGRSIIRIKRKNIL